MRRREFVTLVGGAVVWSFGTAAQQAVAPTHRIGVLAQDLQPGLLETFRNLTTAKALGLTIPASVLSLADELIAELSAELGDPWGYRRLTTYGGQSIKRAATAPVEGQEATRLTGGRTSDGMTFYDGRPRAA